MAKFFHNFTNKFVGEDEAVEMVRGRWKIKVGFCGFNTPANNRSGYVSKEMALKTILKYQEKSAYIKEFMVDA